MRTLLNFAEAARRGDIEGLRAGMASGGADLDAALVEAARAGQERAVACLLDQGANVHARHDLALRYAAQEGHSGTVRALLAAYADPNAENGSALRAAAARGHAEAVDLLLKAGADPAPLLRWEVGLSRLDPREGAGALTERAALGRAAIVKALLEREPGRFDARQALLQACADGDSEVARALLEAGADPFVVAEGSPNPLSLAAEAGHEAVVGLLLESPACPGALKDGCLVEAASRGWPGVARLSLRHGADPDASRGEPLRLAAERASVELLRLLLDAGADPNLHLLPRGATALERAAETGDLACLRLLLDRGACPTLNGGACMELAIQNGRRDALALLDEAAVHW